MPAGTLCSSLFFYRTGREPGNDAALEQQHHDDEQDRHNHGGRGNFAPRDRILALEHGNADRNGFVFFRRIDRQGK